MDTTKHGEMERNGAVRIKSNQNQTKIKIKLKIKSETRLKVFSTMN